MAYHLAAVLLNITCPHKYLKGGDSCKPSKIADKHGIIIAIPSCVSMSLNRRLPILSPFHVLDVRNIFHPLIDASGYLLQGVDFSHLHKVNILQVEIVEFIIVCSFLVKKSPDVAKKRRA